MNTAKLIVESSPGAVVMVSRDGKIELVNSRAEEMFGYDHSELLGQQIEILLPKRTQNQHTQYRRTLTESPTQRKMGAGRDLIARRKDFLQTIQAEPGEVPTPKALHGRQQ